MLDVTTDHSVNAAMRLRRGGIVTFSSEYVSENKKAVLSLGNRAMLQLFFSV